jgi:hypothetical protein
VTGEYLQEYIYKVYVCGCIVGHSVSKTKLAEGGEEWSGSGSAGVEGGENMGRKTGDEQRRRVRVRGEGGRGRSGGVKEEGHGQCQRGRATGPGVEE